MDKNKMKISYIVNARMPTEKAHGYQISKMCEEFSRLGIDVELVVPRRRNTIKKDIFSFYGVEQNFRFKKIKSFDFSPFQKYFKRLNFYFQGLSFLLSLLFVNPEKASIIYTRDPEVAWLFTLKGYSVAFEAHNWNTSSAWLRKILLKHVDGIICNSRGTEKAMRNMGLKNTIVLRNGVDMAQFEIQGSVEEWRGDLSLPNDKKIVMYVGHLYGWKGVDIVVETAFLLKKEKDIVFVFVGGMEKDIEKYTKIIKEKGLKNITLYGFQKKNNIPKLLKSADILLLPNVPITEESVLFTSPIKMFEYMASGVPIIASSLPSIKEVLNEENSILVNPGDPISLASEIKSMLSNNTLANRLSHRAYVDVGYYTWHKRARRALGFLKIKL